MVPVYARLRERARIIVDALPAPDFYGDYSHPCERARDFFETDEILHELRSFIKSRIEDDLGHGLQHMTKVALDAGALMIIEGEQKGYSGNFLDRRILIVQCAALLHDMKRKKKDHSGKGASYARKILIHYPFNPDEIDDICNAIHNHEAFKTNIPIHTEDGELVSDCLYDSDKFRMGPDNFTDTVWDMAVYSNIPLSKFVEYYPRAIDWLARIKDTFRTNTGKKYGPQFIDIGLIAGETLLKVIQTDFSDHL